MSKNSLTQISRSEDEGVEFYTINSTGKSGMSQRGLARFVGISHGTLRGIIDNVVGGSCTIESLKGFTSKTLHLQLPRGCDTSSVNNAVILTAEFCAAVIEHYAFDSKAKSEKALFAFRKFAAIGIEAFIQKANGWQPDQPRQLSDNAKKTLAKLKASGKPEYWLNEKAQGILEHNQTHDLLIEHGCGAPGQRRAINNVLVGDNIGTPKEIRKQRGLSPNANSTEAYSQAELAARNFTHIQFRNRVEVQNSQGFAKCKEDAKIAAAIVQDAIQRIANASPSILTQGK